MQVKTIRNNIEKKMLDWLESITDEQLRKKVKSKLLVSGGFVTSLFLNEKVNDYDIYIQDRQVLMELVDYYTKPFKDVMILDGERRETYIDDELKRNPSAKNIGEVNNQYAVSVRNLKPTQVKLFFKDAGAGMRVNEDKTETDVDLDVAAQTGKVVVTTPKYFVKFFSPNAISLANNIQIVIRFHGNAEEIHKTFDFLHATNYFTFDEGLVTNKAAVESILTKQLKYQGSLYPLTTIIRVRKFLKRGWNINAGELLKVMFQISELNLHDADVLEEQLIGVDVAYFGTLINILRNIEDKTKITSEYLNSIIERVFDGTESEE